MSKLVTEVIKEDYTPEEEAINLDLFTNITEEIIDTRGIYTGELSYEGLLLECMGTLDLIDATQNEDMINRVSKTLIYLLLNYLSENLYKKDIKTTIKNQKAIYKNKNADYINSSEKQIKLDGVSAYQQRLIDKISRMYSYKQRKTLSVADESIKDTISDLCNYMIIYCIWYEKGCERY